MLNAGEKSNNFKEVSEEGKKRVRNHIAPLQPSTLAAFLPWGISKGAGRMTLTMAKVKYFSGIKIINAKKIMVLSEFIWFCKVEGEF